MARKRVLEHTSAAAGALSTSEQAAARAEARQRAVRQMHSALGTIGYGLRLLGRAIALFLR